MYSSNKLYYELFSFMGYLLLFYFSNLKMELIILVFYFFEVNLMLWFYFEYTKNSVKYTFMTISMALYSMFLLFSGSVISMETDLVYIDLMENMIYYTLEVIYVMMATTY